MSERQHHIKCPACEAEGDITLPNEVVRFGCPDDCGAVFVKYRGDVGWAIRCVVRPVFSRQERDGAA